MGLELEKETRVESEYAQFLELLGFIGSVVLMDWDIFWHWNIVNYETFLVFKMRRFLDDLALPNACISTRWNVYVPKKVNIVCW